MRLFTNLKTGLRELINLETIIGAAPTVDVNGVPNGTTIYSTNNSVAVKEPFESVYGAFDTEGLTDEEAEKAKAWKAKAEAEKKAK